MKTVLSVPAVKAAIPSRYRFAARQAFLRASALTNAGHRVECPCCGRHMRRFVRFHGQHDVGEVDYVEWLEQPQRTSYGLRTGEPFYLCAKPERP